MNHCGLPYPVQKCLSLLNDGGYEAFVVGGAVRDMYLGRPIHDYDITTSAKPEEMLQVFAAYKTIATGLKHGTLTVMFEGFPVEITTYRTETDYRDHRHPDTVSFTSDLAADCARRDFTINAMCYHPYEGVLDFYHGEDDLHDHLIRTVGNPAERFREDALRILRALRFASELDFTITADTAAAIHAARQDLSYVSAERIQSELMRLLAGPGRSRILSEYQDVMAVILPPLASLPAARWQNMTAVLPADPYAGLAVLLTGIDQAADILNQLKYSRQEQNTILSLLAHARAPLTTRSDLRRVMSTLQAADAQYAAYRAAMDPDADPDILLARMNTIREDHDCISLAQLAVDGHDLRALGLHGREIRLTLQTLLEAVMRDEVPDEAGALKAYAARFLPGQEKK